MKLIILDRDGVINEDSDAYIKSPAEWIPVPGSLEAIVRLNNAGYRVVVATNQSGLARGLFDTDTLMQIHAKMHRTLSDLGGAIEAVFFCPHGPDDNCRCRKPKPGLFEQITTRLNCNLSGVPAVGDSARDLVAAAAAGASPVLVRSGKGLRTLKAGLPDDSIPIYDDLASFVDQLLSSDPAVA